MPLPLQRGLLEAVSQIVLVIHANVNAHGQIESVQIARESDVRGKFQGPVDQPERRLWWSIAEQASLLLGREFEARERG